MDCKQIILIGMHHTGTSIMSKMILNMGVYGGDIPNDFILLKKNPLKFWERKDVVYENQKRFEEFKNFVLPDWSGYSYLRGIGVPMYLRPNVTNITSNLNTHCNWVTKDPRFGLLLHEWMPLLKNPVCIIIKRNKKETIKSLKRYDYFYSNYFYYDNYNKWSKLYDRYYNDSYQTCTVRNAPILTIQHDELINYPQNTVIRLYSFLHGLRVPLYDLSDVDIPLKPKEAYVTLLTGPNIDYIKGARALLHSIYTLDKTRDIICLTTEDVPQDLINRFLSQDYIIHKRIQRIPEFWWDSCEYKSTYDKQERWGRMMTKLYIWTLPYKRILYLDPDSILLKTLDTIKGTHDLMAQTGLNHPYFNAGVMVVSPNNNTFNNFMKMKYQEHPSLYNNIIDCTEQALLNSYFTYSSQNSQYISRGISMPSFVHLNVKRPEIGKSNEKDIAIHWITKWCPKPWNFVNDMERLEFDNSYSIIDDYKDCDFNLYKLWDSYNKMAQKYNFKVNIETRPVRTSRLSASVAKRVSEQPIRDREYEIYPNNLIPEESDEETDSSSRGLRRYFSDGQGGSDGGYGSDGGKDTKPYGSGAGVMNEQPIRDREYENNNIVAGKDRWFYVPARFREGFMPSR